MKAKDILPKECMIYFHIMNLVSAGTGTVGFRCPAHHLSRELLRVVYLHSSIDQ